MVWQNFPLWHNVLFLVVSFNAQMVHMILLSQLHLVQQNLIFHHHHQEILGMVYAIDSCASMELFQMHASLAHSFGWSNLTTSRWFAPSVCLGESLPATTVPFFVVDHIRNVNQSSSWCSSSVPSIKVHFFSKLAPLWERSSMLPLGKQSDCSMHSLGLRHQPVWLCFQTFLAS